MNYNLVPAAELRKFAYTNCQEFENDHHCIGHLRADFGRHGDEFWSSWTDRCNGIFKTKEFKTEFDNFINTLRKPNNLLAGRGSMRRICHLEQDSILSGCSVCGEETCVFKAESDKYVYILRCNPAHGIYNLYCYCYEKPYFNN